MLAVPRINANDNSFKWYIFTFRGEKYKQYYTMIYIDSVYVWIPVDAKKNPLLVWWPSLRQTSPYSGPMLKIDCSISHKPLAPPLPQNQLLFNPNANRYTYNTIFTMEDNISTLEALSSGTLPYRCDLPASYEGILALKGVPGLSQLGLIGLLGRGLGCPPWVLPHQPTNGCPPPLCCHARPQN
jgi:hypothetical protein